MILFRLTPSAVTEQLIGQELRAYFDSYLERNLFFWARDKKAVQLKLIMLS